jgi:TolB-like protein
MSPEQARGEEVDLRTDIWSFGATLYEMLTGSAPFGRKQGEGAIYSVLPDIPALLHSILYDSVEPPSRLRKDLPRPVEQIILKALDKDRLRRYQNMAELQKDLRLAGPPVVGAPKADKSIIVLPFENISPDPDQDYFCDGMTEEIITDLSHVHDLLVISRSSAMTFKGTKKTIPEIAHAVHVRYVLEGSVRRAGNNLRITAQLIDAANDAHLWAERYAGALDDVFDIQEKVSRSIVSALKLKLKPEESLKMFNRPIDNLAAYECYLRADAEISKWTEDGLNRGLRYLHDARTTIGDNALLYSGMAFALLQLVNIGVKQEEDLEKAEEFGKKALALDPEFPKAHAVLGWIAMWRNPRQVIHHFKKALSISPDDAFALQGLGIFYVMIVGGIAAAGTVCERLIQIDPLHFNTKWLQGAIHFYAGI